MIKLDNDQLTFELARDDENITEARLRAERYAQIQFDSGAQLTAEQVSKACNVSMVTARFALENVGQVIMTMPGENSKEKIYGKK